MAKIAIGLLEVAGAVVADIFAPQIGAFLTNHTFATVTASMVKTAALTMGAMGAGMTMEGISELMQSNGPGIQQSAKTSNAPRSTVYGQTRVAGNCVYSASDGCHTYNQILVWASHPVKSIDHIYIQGREIILSTTQTGEGYHDDGQDHYDISGQKYNFKGKAWICNQTNTHWYKDLYNGLHSVTNADSNWDSSCTLTNMASSYIACTYDANVFSGWPNALAVIHGKCDIYDPRLGNRLNADGSINSAAHIYTNNAALVIADFLTNNDFGCGIDWDSIDIPQLISAANISDEQVPLAGAPATASTSATAGASTGLAGWQANHQYAIGSEIYVAGYVYQATSLNLTSGFVNWRTSGSTQPTFKTATGATTIDGGITWTCRGAYTTSADTWQSKHQYYVGDEITVEINGTQYIQQVTAVLSIIGGVTNRTAAPSGSNFPDFSAATGRTTNDLGSLFYLQWTCMGATPTATSGAYSFTPTGTSECRYTINGAFQWSSTPGEILSSLLDACEGRLTYTGGKFQIWPAAWYGSTLQFDQSDIIDNVKETSNHKFRDKINCVRSVYVAPNYPYAVGGYDQDHPDSNLFNGCWQITDAPEYACDPLHGYGQDIYMAQDGGIKLPTDRRYQFVTSVSQAQRLSKIFLLRNRYQGTYTLSMCLTACQTRPVDVIQMTFPQLGWDNKLLEVNTLTFVQQGQGQTGQGSPSLCVQLECSETSPSIYDWSVAEEMTQEARQSPAAWEATQVADPSSLTLESDLTTAVIGTDGIVTPRIRVTWTEPDDPYTVTGGYIEVRWWTDDDTSTIHTSGQLLGDSTSYYISGVKQGQGVNVQIRASHMNGAVGNWIG